MKYSNQILLIGILAAVIVSSGCIHGSDNTDQEQDVPAEEQDQEPEAPGPDQSSGDEDDLEPRTVVIRNEGQSFEPETVEVDKGRNITFVFNRTEGTHSLRIPELTKGTATLSYEDSENFTVSFDEEGEYDFICSVGLHAQEGMNGTIIVS